MIEEKEGKILTDSYQRPAGWFLVFLRQKSEELGK